MCPICGNSCAAGLRPAIRARCGRTPAHRPTRAPPWWSVMPLLLITGPANAAKAGAVLDRLRAARPRDPLLVVPTAADVEHYQRELAASGFVFGAQVLTFRNLSARSPAAPACARGRSAPSARDRVVRAAIAGVPLRALAGSAAMPGFARAAGDLFAELQRSPRHARPLHRGAARLGGAVARRGTPASSRRSTPRTAAGWRRSGAPTRRATPGRRSTRCGPARPRGAAGPCSSTASTTSRRPSATRSRRSSATARPRCASRSPTSPGRVAFAGRAATVEELRPLAAETLHLPERSEHYAPTARPALHHLERAPVRARRRAASRPTARSGCSRPAASAPRPSSSAPRCSSSCARGSSRATSPCSCAATRRPPRSSRRCWPATASRSRTTTASRSGAPGSARACWPRRARRCPTAAPPTC